MGKKDKGLFLLRRRGTWGFMKPLRIFEKTRQGRNPPKSSLLRATKNNGSSGRGETASLQSGSPAGLPKRLGFTLHPAVRSVNSAKISAVQTRSPQPLSRLSSARPITIEPGYQSSRCTEDGHLDHSLGRKWLF